MRTILTSLVVFLCLAFAAQAKLQKFNPQAKQVPAQEQPAPPAPEQPAPQQRTEEPAPDAEPEPIVTKARLREPSTFTVIFGYLKYVVVAMILLVAAYLLLFRRRSSHGGTSINPDRRSGVIALLFAMGLASVVSAAQSTPRFFPPMLEQGAAGEDGSGEPLRVCNLGLRGEPKALRFLMNDPATGAVVPAVGIEIVAGSPKMAGSCITMKVKMAASAIVHHAFVLAVTGADDKETVYEKDGVYAVTPQEGSVIELIRQYYMPRQDDTAIKALQSQVAAAQSALRAEQAERQKLQGEVASLRTAMDGKASMNDVATVSQRVKTVDERTESLPQITAELQSKLGQVEGVAEEQSRTNARLDRLEPAVEASLTFAAQASQAQNVTGGGLFRRRKVSYIYPQEIRDRIAQAARDFSAAQTATR